MEPDTEQIERAAATASRSGVDTSQKRADPIQVHMTDESEAHCLKLVFQARNAEQPLEIFLHTTQAIHLVEKLSMTICELHRRDSEQILKHKFGVQLCSPDHE
jgi:hypothetical protein